MYAQALQTFYIYYTEDILHVQIHILLYRIVIEYPYTSKCCAPNASYKTDNTTLIQSTEKKTRMPNNTTITWISEQICE